MESECLTVKVLPLHWDDLASLSTDKKAIYVSLCFLVSELNVLQRLSLLSFELFHENGPLEAAARIQSNTLIRTYSSKCFEAHNFVESCMNKAKDSEVTELSKLYFVKLKECMQGRGFKIAEHVRRKMAAHLDFRQVITAINVVKKTPDCNLYVSENDGNCFFPLGEHIIQDAGLTDINVDASYGIRNEQDHQDWVEWTCKCHRAVKDFHTEAFEKFIFPEVNGGLESGDEFSIENRLVAIRHQDYLPLFYTGQS